MIHTPIDITHIPFSRYGAYVSVTQEMGKNELVIHNVQRRFEEGPTLKLGFGKDGTEEFEVFAEPAYISIKTKTGKAKLYIRNDRTIVVTSENLSLFWKMIQKNGYGTETGPGQYRMISMDQKLYITFLLEKGIGFLHGPEEVYYKNIRDKKQQLQIASEKGEIRMAVCLNRQEPGDIATPISPEKEIAEIEKEWGTFLEKLPDCRSGDEITKTFERVTWYNIWSSFARAEDVYHSDIMLMSKKFMSSVWSWDHCFNALVMSQISKEKAMEQFEAPFFLQSPKGALPDLWNPNMEVVWATTKPPIHGWCFSRLMDRFAFSPEELKRVYGYLEKWTDWWMKECDCNQNGIPEYPQGCDCGWDNSSIFDEGFFVESPDLPAYLILQMHTLERIAGELTKIEDRNWAKKEQYWKGQANKLQQCFYEHCWNGERFIGGTSHSNTYDASPTSLITMMPLVLGTYLEEEKRKKLVAILKRDFLTENGLATEMPSSSKYESDGYWRGPIWAPTTYLLVDGLNRGGEKALAEDIACRYCRMSERLAKGNYENFDAITGKGLRAPGYTWSASVYMLLRWEYGK